jgi:Fe2+ or Zn2+ uptake regulation protein
VYQDSGGEAGNIVEQVKLLSSTFSEDKASAVDEEGRLQKTFDNLIGKKNELLSSLVLERDTQQADLNAVNQNLAEQSSALKMAEDVLADQQKLLATVTKQQKEAEEMFEVRKADRSAELEAVKKGLSVLEKVSFVQSVKTDGGKALLSLRKRQPFAECQKCARVAAMLRQKATVYHSSVLSAAAATSMGSDAIDDVVKNLQGLITRIGQEQKTEKEHKEWCEQETGLTTTKREDHSAVVGQLKAVMADLSEVIKEKELSLDENQENINDEDSNFGEQSELRSEGKAEFEEDLQDHMDAIQALNEAIEILANFYAKRAAKLIQTSAVAQPIKQATFLQGGWRAIWRQGC